MPRSELFIEPACYGTGDQAEKTHEIQKKPRDRIKPNGSGTNDEKVQKDNGWKYLKQQTKPGYESSTWREFLKRHDDIETNKISEEMICKKCNKYREYCYCSNPSLVTVKEFNTYEPKS